MSSSGTSFTQRWARPAFIFNAAVAWLGVGLNMVFSFFDLYAKETPEAGLYGGRADGLAGAFGRIFDSLSYFTVWSNIVVGISLTLLARNAARDDRWRHVLRLDGLLMITVTGIVYQVLLAPTANVQGVGHITNTLQHILTPVVTVVVWLLFGPRRWIDGRIVVLALGIPVVWLMWMFGRGAIDGTYPYGFANVTEYGYGPVLQTSATVLVFGLVVELVYWGVDRLLSRSMD